MENTETTSTVKPDEYKQTNCTITAVKCCGTSCNNCMVPTEAAAVPENFTLFNKREKFAGVYILRNLTNTIGRLTKAGLEMLQAEAPDVVSTTPRPIPSVYEELPEYLEPYSNLLLPFLQYNNLREPDAIWADKDKVAAALWGDTAYIFAPAIEDGEDVYILQRHNLKDSEKCTNPQEEN